MKNIHYMGNETLRSKAWEDEVVEKLATTGSHRHA
jgi:hypothetical protein